VSAAELQPCDGCGVPTPHERVAVCIERHGYDSPGDPGRIACVALRCARCGAVEWGGYARGPDAPASWRRWFGVCRRWMPAVGVPLAPGSGP
jgi:hypothetical protein